VNSPDVREAITQIRKLPTLPAVLGQILATTADPDSSAADLGRLIENDQSLSAALLRIANSAYYGYPRQIKSITAAIVRLGFYEMRKLALAATAFRSLSAGRSDYDRVQLWRHAIATAIATERLAGMLGISNEACFVSGLLHDIGKVVLDKLYPGPFRTAARQAHAQHKFVRETECDLFKLDHAQAGAFLAEHWELPPEIVEAIRYHHAPGLNAIDPALVNLVALANFTAYQAGLGESSNGRPALLPETAAIALNIGEPQWSRASNALKRSQDQINDFLSAITGAPGA